MIHSRLQREENKHTEGMTPTGHGHTRKQLTTPQGHTHQGTSEEQGSDTEHSHQALGNKPKAEKGYTERGTRLQPTTNTKNRSGHLAAQEQPTKANHEHKNIIGLRADKTQSHFRTHRGRKNITKGSIITAKAIHKSQSQSRTAPQPI